MPFKTFTNNSILTAAEVNTYLMRQALIFVNDQNERDAIPGVEDGMRVYRRDLKLIETYRNGTWVGAWVQITSFTNSFSSAGGSVFVRRDGDRCALSGQLYRSAAPTSMTAAFTMPAYMAPRALMIQDIYRDWGLSVQISGQTVSVQSSAVRNSSTGYPLDAVSWLV